MVNIPGAMQERFAFTVRSDSLAAAMNGMIGIAGFHHVRGAQGRTRDLLRRDELLRDVRSRRSGSSGAANPSGGDRFAKAQEGHGRDY